MSKKVTSSSKLVTFSPEVVSMTVLIRGRRRCFRVSIMVDAGFKVDKLTVGATDSTDSTDLTTAE